jgi:hypothetical protein
MSTRNLWGRVEVRGGRGREGQTCLADWDRSEQLGPEGTEHERRERRGGEPYPLRESSGNVVHLIINQQRGGASDGDVVALYRPAA